MGIYSEALNLYNNLLEPIFPPKVFSECVYDRLNKVFEVQADIFDDCLDKIKSFTERDITTEYSLKRADYLFKNLHHYAGINRLKLIDIMIEEELTQQNFREEYLHEHK